MRLDQFDYRSSLQALQWAFIEIRACKSLIGAQALADVFHNVPSMISIGRSPEEIQAKVREKAEKHDCWEYVSRFFD